MPTPRDLLAEMIDRFAPEIANVARGVLARIRRMLPGAVEMVYDNAYALVVGFGPTDRASEAVLSVVTMPRRVSVCFLHGVELEDPDRLLQGSGKQVRHVRMARPEDADDPNFRKLVREAVRVSGAEFGGKQRDVQIRAVSKRQRPRRMKERSTTRAQKAGKNPPRHATAPAGRR